MTDEDELDRLLDKLTLRARVRLLTGATTWRTAAEPDIGLRELVLSDGPAGVRGESWDERSTSVLLPSASALAASFDEELAKEIGALLAAEARRKGVHVVLAPNLNLHRSPLAGRHFECFSEDPELTGRTGAALVRGIQAHGVAATAKHYAANDAETDRLTADARLDPRTLREVQLLPFELAVEAGAWAVMAGYNRLNGTTMTAHELLTHPLKTDWAFDGAVVSDWGAVRSTHDTARAALDLAMPGPAGEWGERLVHAVEHGEVEESAVDDKVRRLLRLAARCGALGRPARPVPAPPTSRQARALARRAASAGTVLLTNHDVLPLDPGRLTTLAVIGAPAARTRTQGGGSAGVFPQDEVSVLDGIRAGLRGHARVL
ncbi:glycoside hydrolase family 3 C-terminal domain-containing protein, partial [Streptomyces sp. J2-1]|uniref:glycoside hydrolase family 3 protein n=1 Tax=Streptomyces corallincola TaxID=2851888 RepID=UPI001C37F8F2